MVNHVILVRLIFRHTHISLGRSLFKILGTELQMFMIFIYVCIYIYKYGVSKNGGYPQMDGLEWKIPSINGWFGGTPISGNHSIYINYRYYCTSPSSQLLKSKLDPSQAASQERGAEERNNDAEQKWTTDYSCMVTWCHNHMSTLTSCVDIYILLSLYYDTIQLHISCEI